MDAYPRPLRSARDPGILAPFAAAVILAWPPPGAIGSVHSVAADGTGDFATIQAAIDAAASGDTVRVGPGVYEEHLVIAAKDLLLEGTEGAEATILDGQWSGRVLGIFSSPTGVVLRGLTIRNGVMGGVESNDQGAGVAAYRTGLVVEDCVIRNNIASSLGGGLNIGIFAPPGSPATPPTQAVPFLRVSRTRFIENISAGSGGGIHCDEVPSLLLDCVFEGNHAGQTGGGVDFLQRGHNLERCTFQGNSAFLGAGAAMSGQETLNLADCVLRDNIAENFGGGIWVVNGGGLVLQQVRFFGNKADRGGALHLTRTPLFAQRVLFRDNRGFDRGGAVHLEAVDAARFGYATWFGNDAPSGASLWTLGGSLYVESSIAADASTSAAKCFGGTTVSVSCTVGGPVTGDCLIFVERRSFDPCESSPDLLCTLPSPGACGPVGYAEIPCPAAECATPARPATWGSLKALYRP